MKSLQFFKLLREAILYWVDFRENFKGEYPPTEVCGQSTDYLVCGVIVSDHQTVRGPSSTTDLFGPLMVWSVGEYLA